jgi:hypothetical protein
LCRLRFYFFGIGLQPESQINNTIPLGNKVSLGQLAEDCVEIAFLHLPGFKAPTMQRHWRASLAFHKRNA